MAIILFLLIFLMSAERSPRGEVFEEQFPVSQTRALKGLFAIGIIFHHLGSYIGEGFPSLLTFNLRCCQQARIYERISSPQISPRILYIHGDRPILLDGQIHLRRADTEAHHPLASRTERGAVVRKRYSLAVYRILNLLPSLRKARRHDCNDDCYRRLYGRAALPVSLLRQYGIRILVVQLDTLLCARNVVLRLS